MLDKSVPLRIEVMLERSVPFIRFENWLVGIRQVVVVVLALDVSFNVGEESVRLAFDANAIHAGGGVGMRLQIALVFQILDSQCSVTHELRLTRLIGPAVETVERASNERRT